MKNFKQLKKQEEIELDKKINEYDEKKIEILRKIPVNKWKRVIYIFNELSEYYMVFFNLNDELKYADITYKDIEEREYKIREISNDIKETKQNMMPYIDERNMILKEYLEKEEINNLQNIYVQIASLEKIKNDMYKLDNLLNDKDFFEKK